MLKNSVSLERLVPINLLRLFPVDIVLVYNNNNLAKIQLIAKRDSLSTVQVIGTEPYDISDLVKEIFLGTKASLDSLKKYQLDMPISATLECVYKVPFGSTATYSEIASTLGNVQMRRVCARYCSKNPYPLLIPCHRIVAQSSLGGYFGNTTEWIEVKRRLLEYEQLVVKKRDFL